MKRSYHTINKQGKANERKLADFLSKGGQLLLPMVDLIEQDKPGQVDSTYKPPVTVVNQSRTWAQEWIRYDRRSRQM